MGDGRGGDISVIVVNYNTAGLALEAVGSVLAARHGGRRVEVHLVDNASPAGDGAVLDREIAARGWTDRVTLYRETENHGFGRGNNVVLRALAGRAVPPRYVFLLNPDARLANEAVAALADFLDAHPQAAVAGARIAKPGGIPVTAAFRFPGIVSTFSAALCFGPVARRLARWDVPLDPALGTRRVDWVSGAAVMMRLDAVRDAGFFDPAFFLYFEEVDLMRQIAAQGGQVWHVAEAQVIHVEGAATDVKSGRAVQPRLPGYWYRSWRHYFQKNHGRARALAAAAGWYLGAAGNRALGLLRGRPPAAPRAFYGDFWRQAVRPLIGLGAGADD